MTADGTRSISILAILKRTAVRLSSPSASLLAGALAYYALLSLAPLLYIAIWLVGLFFGSRETRAAVVHEVRRIMGADGANVVDLMIEQASQQSGSVLALLTGILIALFAGSRVFSKLQDALNMLWEVHERPYAGIGAGARFFVQKRLLSFAMVFVVGGVLLLSMFSKAIIAGMNGIAGKWLPEWAEWGVMVRLAEIIATTGLEMLLFGVLYRIMPDVKIGWRSVWPGAAVAALLFTTGNLIIGSFLTRSGANTVPGAAGSLIAVLLWAYYSAWVFFVGAAATYAYAVERGEKLEPEDYAEPVTWYPRW